MRHTKLVVAAAVAAVLGLAASACSSSDDSSPETATTGAAVGGVATAETVARPDTTDTTTKSAPAAPGTEQMEAVSSAETAGSDEPAPSTSGSAETAPSVSSSGSASQGTSEPPSSTTTTATATASTITTTTTTSAAPPTTTTSTTTTTTTTTIPGADDLGGSLRPPERTSSLRPRQRNDVQLSLPASTPRDRYVPGLADINIYSRINDQGPLDLQAKLEELSIFLRYIGNYQPYTGATAENRDTQGTFRQAVKLLEDTLAWLGFTPQNVCGAPAGYSFTDLLQPTREWSEEFKVHRGEAIFTTDRLIELHGGPRINPESNLDFYVRQAVQTAHDALRLYELLDETETPQMILCRAWKMPEGEIPEGANAYWYALLTPGIQPRESLLSQGTYHVKEISRDGNLAYVLVCHPTLGSIYLDLAWRDAGYRAELVGDFQINGCQANFERRGYIADYEPEETIRFGFGERSFSASDLQPFPSVRY